ncbi:hypothetical protein Patl1_08053 [Pistacia atlantica]|uniref:Uncharacterized protein n=1 Tax=Pistacia atlantica TaxID=434234 RepID=A0ACC1AH32_9ROSI|nr:hypothetical protein Patl1_08053 [Pistacia atlantica]
MFLDHLHGSNLYLFFVTLPESLLLKIVVLSRKWSNPDGAILVASSNLQCTLNTTRVRENLLSS